ncbi:DUF4304 domain-containing protein [Sinorhizobium sp. NFACC03]|uniref:DUF4304 domain-containing protein n=1 Tax=Sinorhizobium sp. NFACC03 TaxID=1566295 RepID=UPI0008831DFD|nr:DUF4304 domain-containing protein [Sinorhizobium sp. NFACC03]SDA69258.1 protein of unknown function [Sinorhizobium sp. NFACC03]
MPVANPVADAVSSLLKPLGFRRKSSSWYLENDETVLIVNVQRSQFGPQYYLNFSVVIRAISTVPQPKEYHGDIRFRLEETLPAHSHELCKKLLNLEYPLSDDERSLRLVELIKRHGLRLLLTCNSEAGLKEALESKSLPDWTFSSAARAHLVERVTRASI